MCLCPALRLYRCAESGMFCNQYGKSYTCTRGIRFYHQFYENSPRKLGTTAWAPPNSASLQQMIWIMFILLFSSPSINLLSLATSIVVWYKFPSQKVVFKFSFQPLEPYFDLNSYTIRLRKVPKQARLLWKPPGLSANVLILNSVHRRRFYNLFIIVCANLWKRCIATESVYFLSCGPLRNVCCYKTNTAFVYGTVLVIMGKFIDFENFCSRTIWLMQSKFGL